MNLKEILTPEAAEKFAVYAELLAKKNEEMNLVADARREVVEIRHLLDSASLLPSIRETLPGLESLIDVGTGAGLPGIPLAIALPEVRVTLLDSMSKRCVFLEETAAALGLTNVTVVNARAEEAAKGPLRGSFDLAVSRAVAKLPVLCELCLPFLHTGGWFYAMKSRHAGDELTSAGNALKKLGAAAEPAFDYALPPYPGEEQRVELTAFRFRKTGETPAAYPRSFGAIKKRPL